MKNIFPEKTIFSEQRIQHRKNTSVFSRPRIRGKSAYRPAGYGAHPGQNKSFIEQIKQRPVKTARRRNIRNIKKFKGFKFPHLSWPVFPFFKAKPERAPEDFLRTPAGGGGAGKEAAPGNLLSGFLRRAPRPVDSSTGPGTATGTDAAKEKDPRPILLKEGLPFTLPIAPAAALGGLIIFSVLCLNWQGIPGTTPGPGPLPEPGADGQSQRPLAVYAGLQPEAAAEDGLIPLALTEVFAWEPYTVQKGDSVSKIAQDHALSMDAVIASNGITNARRLREGDLLRLPNMNGIPYTVKKGDSLSKISSGMGVPLEVILDANDLQSGALTPGTVLFLPGAKMRTEDLKLALGELFIYPIRGRLTSPFGWRNDPISGERRYHAALDLAASLGTPVKAAMDGKVSFVGINSVFGKYVILSHAGGYQTLYAHLNQTSVPQGSAVLQGAKIGEVGSTGYSTGPHLHFAVFKNGREVNPLDYLSP